MLFCAYNNSLQIFFCWKFTADFIRDECFCYSKKILIFIINVNLYFLITFFVFRCIFVNRSYWAAHLLYVALVFDLQFVKTIV